MPFNIVRSSILDQESAALLLSVALTIGVGIVIPVYASRQIDLTLRRLVFHCMLPPSIAVIAGAAVMLVLRYSLPDSAVLAFFLGVLAAGILNTVIWWRYLASAGLRRHVRDFFTAGGYRLRT